MLYSTLRNSYKLVEDKQGFERVVIEDFERIRTMFYTLELSLELWNVLDYAYKGVEITDSISACLDDTVMMLNKRSAKKLRICVALQLKARELNDMYREAQAKM
jgi:hypothetical protein